MAIPDVYRPIIANLLKRTVDQTLEWRVGASEQEFFASFATSSLRLSRTSTDEDERFNLSLIDREGNTIDWFSVGWGDDDYAQLEDLFTTARRRALRIDEALAKIQEELEAPDDLPFE